MAKNREDIVMFPFMAQGHIIPFLALALHIEKTTNHTITFVNTPQNIKNLKSQTNLPQTSSIHFLEIPFNSSDHDLPPNTENSDALAYPLIIKLLHASNSLKPVFKNLIKDLIRDKRRPLCIIGDIFFGWTASVAKELGVFHAVFSGSGGFGMACYYSIWINHPHEVVAGKDEFSLPDFQEASRFHKSQLASSMLEADGEDSWSIFQDMNLPGWVNSNGILFNTVEEFDQMGLSYFKKKLNLPVWAIGPILLTSENRGMIKTEDYKKCLNWLNSKPINSVLYISFGSQNTISLTQMKQLAMGLEYSNKNFIWVVRPPIGFDINSEFRGQQWLPEGFEERIEKSGKGLLIHKWGPQLEILRHESTSAFLSHCGWNSVLEALSEGVPLLGWAMAAEQFFNVKFLSEKVGVCVEVARGKRCEVDYEQVAEKIRIVMEDEGIKRKAEEVEEMIWVGKNDENGFRGSSVEALDEFFDAAMAMKMNKSQEVETSDVSKEKSGRRNHTE